MLFKMKEQWLKKLLFPAVFEGMMLWLLVFTA